MNINNFTDSYSEHSYFIKRAEFVNEMAKVFSNELKEIESALSEAITDGRTGIILLVPRDEGFLSLIALLKILGYGIIYDENMSYFSYKMVDLAKHTGDYVGFVVSILSKTDTKELNHIADSL